MIHDSYPWLGSPIRQLLVAVQLTITAQASQHSTERGDCDVVVVCWSSQVRIRHRAGVGSSRRFEVDAALVETLGCQVGVHLSDRRLLTGLESPSV